MIARDRELLSLVRKLNHEMGEIVLAIMREMPGGVLPARKLRELESILRDLADTVAERADEIERGRALVIDGAVIDID